jgi:hypothetical protein
MFHMRGLLIVLVSLTLAATGFGQARRGGGGGGSGSRVGARSFAGGVAGGAVRGGFTGGGYGRGFVSSSRGFVGAGRPYAGGYYGGGYGYAVGLGYYGAYAPSCYDPYRYGAYGCGYPPYGYYAPPVARVVVPRVVIAPRAAAIMGGGWQHFGRR